MTTRTKLFKQELSEVGLKGTRVRLALLELLQDEGHPLTASEIIDALDRVQITADQATIYRILDIFTKKGILTRYEFQEGKFRYELAGNEHHHLICENCGNIADFSDCNISELAAEIKTKKGFQVKRHALEFYGLCRDCQR